jgi:hypothetical protein
LFVSCYKPPVSQILHSLPESVSTSFDSDVLVGELNCKHRAWNFTSIDRNVRKGSYFSLSQYTAVNHPENPTCIHRIFLTTVLEFYLSTRYSIQNTNPDPLQIQDILLPWAWTVRLLCLVLGFSSPCICTPSPIKPQVYSVTYFPPIRPRISAHKFQKFNCYEYLFDRILLTPPMCGATYAPPTFLVSK